jgi:GT2 family glycosyltransferase
LSVAVLIVNWNSGQLLEKCLDTLSRQTLQPEKVIIIDNSSRDGSTDYAEQNTNVTLRNLDTNLGFAAANNRALTECETEYVVLLNPDAFPEPEWLEQLVEAANSEPDAVAFGSRQMIYVSSDLLDGIGDAYHISGLAWRERHGAQQQPVDLEQREIFSPCAAAALYRRQAIVDVGGFDEDFFCYMEDVDLGFRLRLAGYKAMYVPDAVVNHIGSATTGGQQSDFSVYHGHRNLVWTYIKNMPGVLFWLLLPYHMLLNIFTIGWFVVRGQGSVILRAKWDAMMGIPAMWRKRKVIQSNRTASLKDIWRVMDKRLIPWNHRY